MYKVKVVNKYTFFFIYFFVCFLFFQLKANSQQTIITVPSSEVLPKGSLLLKGSSNFDDFSGGKNFSMTPSVTVGSGHGIEFSSAVGTTFDAEKNISVIGNISSKKVWFIGNATRFTAGGTISPYLNESIHPNSFLYAHLSHRIKKTRSSFVVGGYIDGYKHFLNRGGILLGVEQVIIPNKLRIACDWTSGQDSYGKFGVGLKYRPVPTVSITSAVIIPNLNDDNVAFAFSLSKYFSIDDTNLLKRRLTNVD